MAKASKVIYGNETLIDLTADTVRADKLLKGYTAHGADGEIIAGECEYDANTQDGTATDAEILLGKTAYVKGGKKTGTMPNNGAISGVISSKDDVYNVAQGYHDGSGNVQIAEEEKAKLTPNNIRGGVSILGVVGEMSGAEGVNAQSKTVIPTAARQYILPDDEYTHLSQVTVEAIPYVESANSAGGLTVTIG